MVSIQAVREWIEALEKAVGRLVDAQGNYCALGIALTVDNRYKVIERGYLEDKAFSYLAEEYAYAPSADKYAELGLGTSSLDIFPEDLLEEIDFTLIAGRSIRELSVVVSYLNDCTDKSLPEIGAILRQYYLPYLEKMNGDS